MPQSIYERDGRVYQPTEWAGSPWSKSHQHGGPVNALFASAAEAAAEQTGLRVVRLTVDLFRPVPLVGLALDWRFVRKGRRIANIDAELSHPEGDLISRASALLLRASKDQPRSWDQTPPPTLQLDRAEPVEFMPRAFRDSVPAGFHWSFDVRMGSDEHGPAAWITTPLDLLPGQPMTPLQRCA
ncbi:MAG: acyl-CoA thioesterase domain-containing protein, partial [Myxococcota bacterium]